MTWTIVYIFPDSSQKTDTHKSQPTHKAGQSIKLDGKQWRIQEVRESQEYNNVLNIWLRNQ
jgi:hypothetical protein